jgi:hypothetical protein
MLKTNTLKDKPVHSTVALSGSELETQATAHRLSAPRFTRKRRRTPAANQARARAHRARLRARLRAAQARAKRRIQTGRVPIQDDAKATSESRDTELKAPDRRGERDDRLTRDASAKPADSGYDIPALLRGNGA